MKKKGNSEMVFFPFIWNVYTNTQYAVRWVEAYVTL